MQEKKHICPILRKDTGPFVSGHADKGSLAIYTDIFRNICRHKYISSLFESKWLTVVCTI